MAQKSSKSNRPMRQLPLGPVRNASKPRVVRFSINPLYLVLVVMVFVFLLGSLLNTGSTTIPVSVSEFISSIKDNRFARLTIQDTGEILAQPKYVLTSGLADQKGNSAFKEGAEVGFEEITVATLIERLKPQDPLDQLRGILNNQGRADLAELLISDKFVIARTGRATTKDFLIYIDSVDAFKQAFVERNVALENLPLTVTYLRSAAETISEASLAERIKATPVAAAYEVNGKAYVRISDKAIKTYAVQWYGGNSFAQVLQEEGVSLASDNIQIGSLIVAQVPWGDIISLLTLVGFVVLGFFLFRGIQSSGSGLMRFGQTKARMFWGVKPDITFKDVAGVDEAKNELEEIVQFLRTPEKFRKLGARIPKGVIMVGPPGTGKTMLARAIAGEAGVPFFHTSGSEFEEMLVGAGASRVRDLFEKAKKAAPSLIFIDEIDAVARKRGTTIQSGTTEQTLNQILVEMDGFEQGTNVIVIAATNRPDVLDPAILRPGRFDRRVTLDLPDVEGRKQILAVHSQNKPLAADVDLERVAKRTIGFSGAELENTLNEAAIITAKEERSEITYKDIEEAASKVTMGPVRRSLRRTEEEIKLVAVHEAGHAITAKFTPQADPVHRVSILSRGSAGGVTHFLPENDNRMLSRTRLLARLVVGLGGRAAEEIVLGDISTGASSDIQQVTGIARAMIQQFGMSEKLGLIKYGDHDANVYADVRDYSENTAEQIDNEVRALVQEAYAQSKRIIAENRAAFDMLVEELLKHEVLEADEFSKLFEK